jgi:hypothetical protein
VLYTNVNKAYKQIIIRVIAHNKYDQFNLVKDIKTARYTYVTHNKLQCYICVLLINKDSNALADL